MGSDRSYTFRANEILRLMEIRGFSRTALAKMADVDIKSLRRWLAGEPGFLDSAARLAKALNTNIHAICNIEAEDPDSPNFEGADPVELGRISDFFSQLDLRNFSQGIATAHHRRIFSYLPPSRKYASIDCATQGDGMRARMLNRENHEFLCTSVAEPEDDAFHLKKQYQLRTPLSDSDREQPFVFECILEYINGYRDIPENWFHAHIIDPTDALTYILVFPEDKPCKKVWGTWKVGHSGKAMIHPVEPVLCLGGHTAWWHIHNAKPAETYEIRWRW